MGIVKRPDTGASRTIEPLRATIEPNGTSTRVTLSGAIDESSKLEALFAQLTGDTVFNMRNVERVNSMGVHRWIPLISKFSAQHQAAFDEISYALVQNANVVANLFGTGHVRSCMAPYFCAKCKTNVTLPVTQEEVASSLHEPPPKACERCNGHMEFDELDNYFGFFKARGR
jgi:hypothetical protein